MGLFSPKWKSKDRLKAERAIEKIAKEETLLEAALNAPHESVCVMAANKLTDNTLLMRAVLSSNSERVSLAAVRRLSDTGALLRAATGFLPESVCLEAVNRLDGDDALRQAALDAKREKVCLAAAQRLQKEEPLLKTALETKHESVCLVAVEKLRDTASLERAAKGACTARARCLTAGKLPGGNSVRTDVFNAEAAELIRSGTAGDCLPEPETLAGILSGQGLREIAGTDTPYGYAALKRLEKAELFDALCRRKRAEAQGFLSTIKTLLDRFEEDELFELMQKAEAVTVKALAADRLTEKDHCAAALAQLTSDAAEGKADRELSASVRSGLMQKLVKKDPAAYGLRYPGAFTEEDITEALPETVLAAIVGKGSSGSRRARAAKLLRDPALIKECLDRLPLKNDPFDNQCRGLLCGKYDGKQAYADRLIRELDGAEDKEKAMEIAAVIRHLYRDCPDARDCFAGLDGKKMSYHTDYHEDWGCQSRFYDTTDSFTVMLD